MYILGTVPEPAPVLLRLITGASWSLTSREPPRVKILFGTQRILSVLDGMLPEPPFGG